MPGNNLDWRQSGATGLDTAQTNIAISLGGDRSSTTLFDSALGGFESTVTTATTGAGNRHLVKDSARSGDATNAHRGKYLVAVTGANADVLFLSRVRSFQVVTGVGIFELVDEAPADWGVGVVYRVFDAANIVVRGFTAAELLDHFKVGVPKRCNVLHVT
ncbi:hypothetical protein LCGC14_2815010, partial [marine sediment metagenome]